MISARVGQLAKQPPDMGDDAGIERAERHAFEVSDLVECRSRDEPFDIVDQRRSIISDEKAELSASINAPSIPGKAMARVSGASLEELRADTRYIPDP